MRIIGVFLGLFAILSLAGAVAALSSSSEFTTLSVAQETLVVDN